MRPEESFFLDKNTGVERVPEVASEEAWVLGGRLAVGVLKENKKNEEDTFLSWGGRVYPL